MRFFRAFLRDLIMQEFIHVPKVTFLLLFASGFVLLAIQILGVRVLGPWLGTAIPVWATVIGVMLTGSALGYFGGGALADRRQSARVVFLLASVGGVCVAAIPHIRVLIPMLHDVLPYHGALFLSAILILLPASLLISALITYLIRLSVDSLSTISQMHGDLYTIATLGSISAVFLTSYYLIPTFTLPHIFYALGILVITAGLLYLYNFKP